MTLTTLQLSDPDCSVAFRDQGAGPPVLLIHGVGLQSAAWSPQIEALSRTHRVIAVDMPGHGRSTPLPASSQLPDFVVWCHAFVQALGLGPVSIAGHSMGALIAGGFAATCPHLTARVCLINGVYCRDAPALAAVIARATDIAAGQIDLEPPLSRWFADTPAERAPRADVARWLAAVDPAAYATAYAAFARGDATYAHRYPDITCPFLAITGDGDPNSTPAMSAAMAAKVQNGRAITVKGHRHMLNLTAPDVVNAHLVDWLNGSVSQEHADDVA